MLPDVCCDFVKFSLKVETVLLVLYITITCPDMEFPMMDQGIEESMCDKVEA